MYNRKNIAGFSLVELSVTLVIVGLVAASITSGAHLIQAAKLNKIISEITGYVTAVNNFKDKYKAWPGDMPNATSYWGTYSSGPPISGTNNGNGNEKISGLTTEALYAWRQMSLSNMIAGNYSGASAGSTNFVAGTNVPASSIKGANYYLYYFSAATTSYTVFGTSGNVLQLGAADDTTSPWISAISPADAHIIDSKIDDGIASTGSLYAVPSGVSGSAGVSATCVDNNYASSSATYILTDNTASCRILYWLSTL